VFFFFFFGFFSWAMVTQNASTVTAKLKEDFAYPS